jgi:hypothetical protein
MQVSAMPGYRESLLDFVWTAPEKIAVARPA